MATTDHLLTRNRHYAADFQEGGRPAEPARALAVLTCMDARIHPERLLDLGIGDAHVIRNAGGRASDDAVRSLVVSTALLGTRACMVIHHTRCGMLGLADDDLRAQLAAQAGADASSMAFLGFDDLEGSVRDDVRSLRTNPLLPTELEVTGYLYDVDTGLLSPVDVPAG